MQGGVRITVHFHGGTTAVTTLTDEDIADICQELKFSGVRGDCESIDDCIEAILGKPGKPTFQWLGDVYLHPQAVCGIELLDLGGNQ